MKSTGSRLLWITLGVVSMTIGTHVFLVPNALATGGVTGLAIIVNFIFPQMSVGGFMLFANIVLFIFGLATLGRQFGVLTLYGTFLYSGLTAVLEAVLPIKAPLSPDVLVNLIFGCAFMGIGLALVFHQNASTGGTDIIAKFLNAYFHVPIARAFFITDAVVVLLSACLISIDRALYAMIGIWMQSAILDYAIAGAERRIIMTIISKKADEINRFINVDMNRGSTIYQAEGGYSGEARRIVVSVVHRPEYIRITDFVKKTDPRAFVYIHYVSEVFGEGFSYRIPSPKQKPLEATEAGDRSQL